MINRAENRYVFIDTETGGIKPSKHSLLSIGLVIWEYKTGILGTKEFYIKHDNYYVTQEATRINKFNEESHGLIALSPKQVIEDIISYLQSFFPKSTAIPLIGHNVQFDIAFLKHFFSINGRSFDRYFSHRSIDTYSVYKTLVISGVIKSDLNSSTDAFRYFQIPIDERHNALSDCLATVKLYENMLELISN